MTKKNPGNGAREALAKLLNVSLERADILLAALWIEGFKLSPLAPTRSDKP